MQPIIASSNRVSLIVVTHNSERYIHRCLESALSQNVNICDVLVVDNCSSDSTLEVVKRFGSKVRIIHNQNNVGFARAVNQGIKHSTGTYVALINPDVELEGNFLELAVGRLTRDPSLAAVGACLAQFENRDVLDDFADVIGLTLHPVQLFRSVPIRRIGRLEALETLLTTVCAAAAVYRRDALEEIGGVCEDYFLYYEDVDLGLNLRMRGYRSTVLPYTMAFHVGAASSGGTYARLVQYNTGRGQILLIHKNFTLWLTIFLGPFIIMSLFTRTLRGRLRSGDWSFLEGVIQGLRDCTRVPKRRCAFGFKHLPKLAMGSLLIWRYYAIRVVNVFSTRGISRHGGL